MARTPPPDPANGLPGPGALALGYARVSTAEQAGSGLGLDAQRAAITAACRQRGWELTGLLVDAGVSAGSAVRPALAQALDALQVRPGPQVLVVAKLDRLARSVRHYARLLDLAEAEGWSLLALDVESSTPQGRFLRTVLAGFAELERELISLRTREALAAARARGTVLGRPVDVEDQVADVIAELRRRRWPATRIARELERRGLPAPRGGTTWHTTTVTGILRRRGLTVRPVGRLRVRRPTRGGGGGMGTSR
jgi:DNA invertase Pin-like site-specific DNA recombinase